MNKEIIEIGFEPLSQEHYFSLMENESWGYTSNNADAEWHIYQGHLTLEPEELVKLYGKTVIIKGDLIVNGDCDLDDILWCFVLGDIYADSLFLGSSTIYVSGTVNAKRSLHIHGGSGAPVKIAVIKAPYVYNDSDACLGPVDTN